MGGGATEALSFSMALKNCVRNTEKQAGKEKESISMLIILPAL